MNDAAPPSAGPSALISVPLVPAPVAGAARRAIVLDAEQQAAILQPGNLVVRAGAGSGKTEVLARRFVAMLAGDLARRAPLAPAALAAITFTEKAALDLHSRIALVLAERIAEERAPERRLHLVRAQRTLALARISTIHAFCARILRENPVAAGLDPAFEVLDEYESATLFERVCRQTLVDALRAGDPGARFLLRARRFEGGAYSEGALEIVHRLFVEARRAGHPADWIVAQTQRAAEQAQTGDIVADHARQLVDLIDRLLAKRAITSAASARLEPLRELWGTARPAILGLDRSAKPEALEILREICHALPEARKPFSSEITEIRTLVIDETGGFGLDGELVAAWGEWRALPRAIEVARVIAHVGAAFDTAKREQRALGFDDLLSGVRDLLRRDPEVATRYRAELRALLVDEYQDTNRLQDEIVTLLTAPGAPGEGAPPELFIVGDEKQSIYRFRGADVQVFNLPRTPTPESLPLAGNRRSTSNILNFVNGLGAISMAPRNEPLPYRVEWHAGHALVAQRATALDYPVELLTAIVDPPEAASKLRAGQKRELEARAIANRIGRLVADGEPIVDPLTDLPRPVEYRDIVVLFRAFSDIRAYEDALSRAALPSYTVQGRGFYGRREVIDLTALLAAVDDPRDSLQLAAALRSPLFALSDDCLLELALRLHDRDLNPRFNSLAEIFSAPAPDLAVLSSEGERAERAWRVLGELRDIRGRLGLAAIVERALELTDYESVMAALGQGHQRIANLRKVVELAHRFDARGLFTFHDFVAYLRRLVATEPFEPQAQILGEGDNVVRLMTVHQAKGLEFPVVIVADAGRGPNGEKRSPLLDPQRGLLLRDTDGSGADEIPNAALNTCRARLNDEEQAESARILYVALTRARDRLIISEGAGTGGWATHLRDFIGRDHWMRLAEAGDGALELEAAGARVALRHPDCAAPAVSIEYANARASASRVDAPAELARRRLTFAIQTGGDLIVSPTALADFERCPRQYWLRHERGVPEGQVGAGGRGGLSRNVNDDPAALGLVAHAILEQVESGAGGPRLEAEIAELAERLGPAAGLSATSRVIMARDLSRYVAAAHPDETVIGREVPFTLNVASSLFVRGQIDLLARTADTLLVRDYKYATAADARRYRVQMECYALAAAEVFAGVAIVAQIVALRENPEPINLPLPPAAEIRARLAALGDQLGAARRAAAFPKRPPGKAACHALGCGYVRVCWRD